MATLTGNRFEITRISAWIHDTNEISMLSGSSTLAKFVRRNEMPRFQDGDHWTWKIYSTLTSHYSSPYYQHKRHRYSRRNFVSILFLNWDIRIWHLKAAMLDFSLPVSSRLVLQHCNYSYWIAGPRKHSYIRWKLCCYLVYKNSKFRGRHLGLSTSGYLLTSECHHYNTRVLYWCP